jgi:TPR repeat protein
MIWRSVFAALLIIGLHSCTSEPMDFDAVEARAQQGDAYAQNNLGFMYASGKGVPENDIEAVKWYRLAAQQGDADAQFNLGFMYASGKGVPQNYREAVKWYRLAAQQGDAYAQNNLGLRYDNGEGVPTNYVKAYAWMSMAAAQGNEIASENKSIVTKKMTPQQIAEAQAYATRCFENDYKGCD